MTDQQIGAGCGAVLGVVLLVGVLWVLLRHPFRKL